MDDGWSLCLGLEEERCGRLGMGLLRVFCCFWLDWQVLDAVRWGLWGDASTGQGTGQPVGDETVVEERRVVEVELDPFVAGGGRAASGGRLVVQALEEGDPWVGAVEEPGLDGEQLDDLLIALGDIAIEEESVDGRAVVAEREWTKDGEPEEVVDVEEAVVATERPVEEEPVEEAVVEEAVVEAMPAVVQVVEEEVVEEVVVVERDMPFCGEVPGSGLLYVGPGGDASDGELDAVWHIAAGETVASVMRSWGEPHGWSISDSASVEWSIGHSAACQGSLMGAISYLVDALASAVPGPVVTAFGGNRVLLLEDDGSVQY